VGFRERSRFIQRMGFNGRIRLGLRGWLGLGEWRRVIGWCGINGRIGLGFGRWLGISQRCRFRQRFWIGTGDIRRLGI